MTGVIDRYTNLKEHLHYNPALDDSNEQFDEVYDDEEAEGKKTK